MIVMGPPEFMKKYRKMIFICKLKNCFTYLGCFFLMVVFWGIITVGIIKLFIILK